MLKLENLETMERCEQLELGLQYGQLWPLLFSIDMKTTLISESPMGWGFVNFALKGYRGLIFCRDCI